MKKKISIALALVFSLSLTSFAMAKDAERQEVEKLKVMPVHFAQATNPDPNLAILPGSAQEEIQHRKLSEEQDYTAIIPGTPDLSAGQIPQKNATGQEADRVAKAQQSQFYYGSPSAYLTPKPQDTQQGYSKGRYKVYHYMPETNRAQGTETLISELSREVAGKVFYGLKDDGEKHHSAKVAIVGAVPLADLKRETEFGRMMAEYLLTDLSDRGIRVTELRLGKEINILAQTGEFILSRNINELANNNQELDYVVVSTFTNTRKTLVLQGRMIDLKNGIIKTAWRYTLPLNRELLGLFHTIQQPYTIAVKGARN